MEHDAQLTPAMAAAEMRRSAKAIRDELGRDNREAGEHFMETVARGNERIAEVIENQEHRLRVLIDDRDKMRAALDAAREAIIVLRGELEYFSPAASDSDFPRVLEALGKASAALALIEGKP